MSSYQKEKHRTIQKILRQSITYRKKGVGAIIKETKFADQLRLYNNHNLLLEKLAKNSEPKDTPLTFINKDAHLNAQKDSQIVEQKDALEIIGNNSCQKHSNLLEVKSNCKVERQIVPFHKIRDSLTANPKWSIDQSPEDMVRDIKDPDKFFNTRHIERYKSTNTKNEEKYLRIDFSGRKKYREPLVEDYEPAQVKRKQTIEVSQHHKNPISIYCHHYQPKPKKYGLPPANFAYRQSILPKKQTVFSKKNELELMAGKRSKGVQTHRQESHDIFNRTSQKLQSIPSDSKDSNLRLTQLHLELPEPKHVEKTKRLQQYYDSETITGNLDFMPAKPKPTRKCRITISRKHFDEVPEFIHRNLDINDFRDVAREGERLRQMEGQGLKQRQGNKSSLIKVDKIILQTVQHPPQKKPQLKQGYTKYSSNGSKDRKIKRDKQQLCGWEIENEYAL